MNGVSSMQLDSPIGRLHIFGHADGLRAIMFEAEDRSAPRRDESVEAAAIVKRAAAQLSAYFAGQLQVFDLPLASEGTAFQLATWQELQKIPYGQTISYAELARRIDKPRAVRAVGAANGRNPLPIVIPCHRVIGSDGTLTGYAGGLAIKRQLLVLEGALPCDSAPIDDGLFAKR